MTKKAATIIKLLKKGYSPKEVTERVAVSYNYAWKLKRDLEAAAAATAEEAMRPVKETILSVANTMFPNAGEFIVVEGAKSAQEVDAILNERASNYGPFATQAKIAQLLKTTVTSYLTKHDKALMPDQQEALDMIFSKIGRILNGDPDHIDSWIDISGYATLVADRLQGKAR
jgi:hypothetical protein